MQGSDQETISEQAQDWVVRLASGDMTAAELGAFEAWLGQSDAHERAFADERRFWHRLSVLDETFDRLDSEAGQPETGTTLNVPASDRLPSQHASSAVRRAERRSARRSETHRSRYRLRRVSAIAGIALVLCLMLFVSGTRFLPGLLADHASGLDRTLTITLADGSRLILNRDSAVRVAFGDAERRVDLLKGEVFVDVTPDPARPFRVYSDDGISEAVGTAYAVRCLNDRTRVAVTEGHVAVSSGAAAGRTISLKAGEGIRYGDGRFLGKKFALPGSDPWEDALAWRQGKVVFVDRPLAEALAELERYHRGRILVLGKDDVYQRVSGVIDLDRLADGVTALAATHGLKAVHLTPYLTVIR